MNHSAVLEIKFLSDCISGELPKETMIAFERQRELRAYAPDSAAPAPWAHDYRGNRDYGCLYWKPQRKSRLYGKFTID